MKFTDGDIVILVAHSPREKLVGVLQSIDPAGVTLRSIEIGYFDDWCRSLAAGEPSLSMADNFVPMWRIERVTRDEGNWDIPSMDEQFRSRTGMELRDQ